MLITVAVCGIRRLLLVQLTEKDDNCHGTFQLQVPFSSRVLATIWKRDEYSVEKQHEVLENFNSIL